MIRPRNTLATTALIVAAFLAVAALPAQTLARPGWVGSGMTAQSWFRRAVFYAIDTRTFSDSNADGTGDLKGITQRLDYIHSLGADAILLRPLDSPSVGCSTTVVIGETVSKVHCVSAGTSPSPATPPINPALGTLSDLDDLTQQASRLNIRILLELPTPDPAVARFWLTRGVAGLYIPGSSLGSGIEAIRRMLPNYVGQRVLITDADATATSASKFSNELVLYRATLNSAATLVPDIRAALDQSQTLLRTGIPVFAIGDKTAAPPDSRLARIMATALLLNRSAALISAGQELGFSPPAGSTALIPWGKTAVTAEDEVPEPSKPVAPVTSSPDKYTPYVPYVRPVAPKKPVPPDPNSAAGQEINPKSLLNFYSQLNRLHHGTTALRDGEEITFNHDDRNALVWMRRPVSPSQVNPPILIACNPTEKPVVLSLKADVLRLQLHGTFLRTILRTDDLMGGTSLDPITLPPFGVYVGQLRF